MIARELRLRHPYEFARVRKRGRSWTTKPVVLVVLPNDLGQNRYGFAVGRRVGKAVRRTLIKRWMREAVRPLHPKLNQGYDMIFIARGRLANLSSTYHDVADSIRILTERANLLSRGDDAEHTTPAG